MKVFIADDSMVTRQRLAELVRRMDGGMEVGGEAGTAGEALQAIRETRPDVVILDIQMPEGGGLRVLEEIKQERPETIMLIFTNFPYPQFLRRCKELGAAEFLSKSTDFDELQRILAGLNAPQRC